MKLVDFWWSISFFLSHSHHTTLISIVWNLLNLYHISPRPVVGSSLIRCDQLDRSHCYCIYDISILFILFNTERYCIHYSIWSYYYVTRLISQPKLNR
jgi:hypothetical protein